MIDYGKFRKALTHLKAQHANYVSAKTRVELLPIDREAIAESVIQRFETCYDTAWKDAKRFLTEEVGLPDVPNSPKPILKLAAQNHLLGSAIERWLGYADARVSTAHDYSGKKAKLVLKVIATFLKDAEHLYQAMTGKRAR